MERVPIVDEEGNRIGEEYRSVAHERELLHPAVRIVMKLSDGRFVFQRRSLTKEANPGKITLAATGHVKAGQTLEVAALEELLEETGVHATAEELTYLGSYKDKVGSRDVMIGKKHHRVYGYFYGYCFPGTLEDLKPEENEVDGFETYSLSELKAMTIEEREKFVKIIFAPEVLAIFEKYN